MNTPSTHTNDQLPLDTLFSDLDDEFAATRRLLERYPDEHADWQPHERSMTLASLAAHVANLPHFGEVIASAPEFNFADDQYMPPTARTRTEILDLFDRSAASSRRAIGSLDADAMAANWCMRDGDTIYISGPRAHNLRRFMVSHIAHHRGQLTVYYRLLGVPVPGIYGPSADEG